MSRPIGTKKKPTTAPESIEQTIVRAIFPAGFSVDIPYRIFEIHNTREMLKHLKDGRISMDDIVIYTNGEESERITARKAIAQELARIQQEFETQCTIAVLHGNSNFFEVVAKCVLSLASYPKAKLAVADAWYFLHRYCGKNPTAGEVANHANNLTDKFINASKASDYLDSMGIIKKGGK
jgi:hypothetical protein